MNFLLYFRKPGYPIQRSIVAILIFTKYFSRSIIESLLLGTFNLSIIILPSKCSFLTECPNEWEEGKWATQDVDQTAILSTKEDISSKSKCASACLKQKEIESGITNVNFMDKLDEKTGKRKYECECIISTYSDIYKSRKSYGDAAYQTCVLLKGVYSFEFPNSIYYGY